MSYEQVYNIVQAAGGMSIRQIAAARGISASAAQRAVQALERRGALRLGYRIFGRSTRGVETAVYMTAQKVGVTVDDARAIKNHLRAEFVAAHPGSYVEDLIDIRELLGLPTQGGSADWLVRRGADFSPASNESSGAVAPDDHLLIALPALNTAALRNAAPTISRLAGEGHDVSIITLSVNERSIRKALDRGPEPLMGWPRDEATWRQIYQTVQGDESAAIRDVLRFLKTSGGTASVGVSSESNDRVVVREGHPISVFVVSDHLRIT